MTESCTCRVSSQYPTKPGFRQKSAALESIEQRYAVEVVKPDADEDFLRRMEHGIRLFQENTQSTGQCSLGMHFLRQFGLLFCIVSEQNQCGLSASAVGERVWVSSFDP